MFDNSGLDAVSLINFYTIPFFASTILIIIIYILHVIIKKKISLPIIIMIIADVTIFIVTIFIMIKYSIIGSNIDHKAIINMIFMSCIIHLLVSCYILAISAKNS